MAQVPETAQVLKENGEVVTVPTEDLNVGERVVVSKGNRSRSTESLTANRSSMNQLSLANRFLS